MATIIIKESQLVKLCETAMDLDIYVQPVEPMVPGTNDDLISTLESLRDRAQEILQMAENNVKIREEGKREIYRIFDQFMKAYEMIKYVDKSEN